ncbi:MAG: FHA domain-containing protein [Deltaproteobacteria bacterium]|nr:FHA domain-containing protein [Deltaproteobacteria bacterium]
MANDFDCSIDYLVNEAMRYYARSKNYQSPGSPQMTGGAPVAPNNSGPASYPNAPPKSGNNRPAPGTSPPPGPANTAGPTSVPAANRGRPAPPTPGYAGGNRPLGGPTGSGGSPSMMNAGGHHGGGNMSNGPGLAPHPAPAPAPPPGPAPGGAGPTLFLIYNGQRYPVTKDQFIIGRGSKTSDLAIKDGNISRKHAAVIRRNGTFYIKDLGSTNGIDYKGMRIDNKRIDEGDVFHLCDYELRFTYRAD